MLKAVVREGTWAWHASFVEARQKVAFAYLVTALLFARSGLYAERAQRPGPAADRLLAVPGHRGRADLRAGQRRAVLELLHLLRHAVLRDRLRLDDPLALRAGRPACCCARPATAAARCSSARASTSRRSTTRSWTRSTRRSTCSGSSRSPRGPTTACARSGRIEDLPAVLEHHRVQEVIIADPDFPEERAVELVDQCHRRGVTVRVAPSTMEILRAPGGVRARRVGAAVRAAPAGVRRLRLLRQAQLRLRRRAAPAARC